MWIGNISNLPVHIQNMIEFEYKTYRSFFYQAKLNDEQLEELIEYSQRSDINPTWSLSKTVEEFQGIKEGDIILCINKADSSKSIAAKVVLISLENEKERHHSSVLKQTAEIHLRRSGTEGPSYLSFPKQSDGGYSLDNEDYTVVKTDVAQGLVEQFYHLNQPVKQTKSKAKAK